MVLKSNRNTKDRTLHTCRIVLSGHVKRILYDLSDMSEQRTVLWAPTFVLQYGRRRHLPYQKNMVEPTTYIQPPTILWVPTNHLVPDVMGNKAR